MDWRARAARPCSQAAKAPKHPASQLDAGLPRQAWWCWPVSPDFGHTSSGLDFQRTRRYLSAKRNPAMATPAFEEIAETFEFLDDWEDRYRHVIDLGKAMPPLDDSFKVPALKVDGCASQVWLRPMIDGGRFDFQGESDAMIVRGLIAVLHALYSGVPLADVARIDAHAELGRLGLNEHLSAQRSNGVRAMVERIRKVAAAA
jgi:cysteine desulfuration protein SufE